MIVNGVNQTTLSIADRAIQFGDGCFTTISVVAGKLAHWPEHKSRLTKSLKILDILFEDWKTIHQHLIETASSQANRAVIKLIITRGEGGRGYSPEGVFKPTWIITVHPFPERYLQWPSSGIALGLCQFKLAKQPQLAGIKHLNRLEQVLIKQELMQKKLLDGVVCDTDGKVVETSVANIFWKINGSWFTPPLNHCGVEGVMRNLILTKMKEKNVKVQIQSISAHELEFVDEIFICNSLMGIVPVNRYLDKCFDSPHTRTIQRWLEDNL